MTYVTAAPPDVPYRGIEPFRPIDSSVFFSRAEETRALLQQIWIHPALMLYGESGVGKTSLLGAGLIPAAGNEGFVPERIRVQPEVEAGEIAIERLESGDPEKPHLPSNYRNAEGAVLSIEDFRSRLEELDSRVRPLLIFDQFEELVTRVEAADEPAEVRRRADGRQRIVELIADLVDYEKVRVKVLLAFREDYLADVTDLLSFYPTLVEEVMRLKRPPLSELWNIIRGPFERWPGHFRRELPVELADLIAAELQERDAGEGVNLPELQIACLRLWNSDAPMELFKEGIGGLIADYSQKALDGLQTDLRVPAVALLDRLVTRAGVRNIVSEDDLTTRVIDEEGHRKLALTQALEALQVARLVRRETARGVTLYEVASEFLIPWIVNQRKPVLHTLDQEQARRLSSSELPAREAAASGLFEGLVDEDQKTYFVNSAGPVERYRDYHGRLIDYPYSTEEKWVTTLLDARGFSRIHRLLELGGKRAGLLNVRAGQLLEDRSKHAAEGEPTSSQPKPEFLAANSILIGSPVANPLTGHTLAEFRCPFQFDIELHLAANSTTIRAIVDLNETRRWPSESDRDYGMLVKLKADGGAHSRIVLIAAGLGPSGTLAACHYLDTTIVELHERFRTAPFGCVIEVDKAAGPSSARLVASSELPMGVGASPVRG